jgi:ribose transport system permease protein
VLALARALAAVVCVIALFAIVDVAIHGANAKFWTLQNLQSISVQNDFIVIAAVGMLLVIIAGGIDLSAGVMMALCATVIAWGMREDIGFLITHGENVPQAARRMKIAAETVSTAESKNDSAQLQQAKAQLDHERKRLAELLAIKVEQLEAQSPRGTQSQRAQWTSRMDDLKKALSAIREPDGPTEVDPYLLSLLPNAAGSPWLALLMGVGTGMLCGLLNGVIIVFLRVVPFIGTLGTMMIYLGLGQFVADETTVRPTGAQVPGWIEELSFARPDPAWLVLSKGVWLALVIAGIMACILRYTVFGRYVFAIGSNESTARLCGINVPATKIAVYVLSGLLVGIAAVCSFAATTTGDPSSGMGLELKFIAAVVIGGGSLSGGRGTVIGALAGAIIMGVIGAGCTLLGMRNWLQYITLGVIIVVAVAIDQLRQKRE